MTLLDELVEHMGVGHAEISRIVNTAPARYKTFPIAKRSGGTRTIAQPSRELKDIQRYVLSRYLERFPVHAAASAYVSGRGIASNARAHLYSKVILKLDFQQFFPSIVAADWIRLLKRHPDLNISKIDQFFLTKILFWGVERRSIVPRALSIGAPTSPMLSNIVMFELDVAFAAIADELQIAYTRYADDITVSGASAESVRAFEKMARRALKESKSPKLAFNEEKRGLYTRGQRRMVTGVIITPEDKISMGRGRKREISTLIHKSSLGLLDPEQRGHLKGLLGFAVSIEPEFLSRLRTKYGDGPVDDALRYHVPKRQQPPRAAEVG